MSDAVVLSFLYMDGATDLRLGYIKSSDRAAQTPFYFESKTISYLIAALSLQRR